MVHDLVGDLFVEKVAKLKGQMIGFLLSPSQWRTYSLTYTLSWQSVKFTDENKASVPNQRGVYAFVVHHDNVFFPPHGFIMYIGITGIRGHKRTLRTRFSEYLVERQRNKRRAIHFMLNAYKDDLLFFYAPVTSKNVDLQQLEMALNDAIVPPANKTDFSAEMRTVKGAF